jgi:hypothetical protein
VLSRIRELNLDYVELLITEHANGHSASPFCSLPTSVLDDLARLSAAGRDAIADAPFSLYSLGFENREFWRAATVSLDSEPVLARYAALSVTHLHGPFCQVALFCAWHVRMTSPAASRVLYAMPNAIGDMLAVLPLWRLQRIAADSPGLLQPRWPTNPRFWPDLIRFAADRDTRRLSTTRLLGSQLIAAELDAAVVRERESTRTPRVVRSPRLRATKRR